eukprot:29738-Pyramimonas_sp.AAC.1
MESRVSSLVRLACLSATGALNWSATNLAHLPASWLPRLLHMAILPASTTRGVPWPLTFTT